MSEKPGNLPHNVETTEGLTARQRWEYEEQISELEAHLREHTERARLSELEVNSLRHELELRVAYNTSLEKISEERLREIEWLRRDIEFVRERLTAEANANHGRPSRRARRVVGSLVRRSPLLTRVARRARRFMSENP